MDTALQSSVWVSSPEFAGWLVKRGFHWRKLWKRRWVALHGAEIVYMDKEPTLENSGTMTITKAHITAATVIDREDIDGNPNGFAIHINDGHSPTWFLRAETTREKKSWLMRLSHVYAIVKWLEDFEKVRVLGVGGTGIVYELLHKTNGQRFAMKEMEIKNKTQMQMAISEAEMLKDIMENISHPNIMHIEKVFQVGSKFYLVFPLCTGGELYEHIIRRGHFTERDAAKIIHDIISGLHALHQHDILHLDIKPENILFDSMADDATIKITDFGLAKVFTNIVETQSQPTAELMAEKLKAFAESGELNRERLRGTVGYMSPELILTGHCSKATDVFAAGVVLYILLCGRPPFHSKSNREVLEKTAKGVYKLTGPEWDEVSEEAKDLVRKMLVSNPDERISTQDILDHSWIKESCQPLVEDQDGSIASSSNDDSSRNSSIGALSRDPSNPSRSTTLQKKVSTGTNLSGALKLLSGHVQKMRSEKLETNVTRLVSMLQQGGRGSSSLADKYLIPIDTFKDIIVQPIDSEKDSKVGTSAKLSKALSGGGVPNKRSGYIDSAVCEQELLNALSGELKQAIVAVVGAVGENNGKLSIEQFLGILRHLGYIPRQSLANGVNLAPLIACKFIDRDGDGYISPDDLFTTHAQVFQRSEAFLRMVFRVYIETVWYPGRQINLISWMQHMPLKASTTAGVVDNSSPDKEISRESNGFKVLEDSNHLDVVEPPKYITARHVSALFEKMGYDPQCGQKVFAILCEAIERIKQKERAEFEANGGKSYYNMRGADDRLSNISESSSKESLVGMDEVEVARGSINSKRNSAASLPVPPPLSTPNAALAAAFGDISMNEQIDQSRNSDAIPQKNSVSSIRNRTTSQSHGNAGDKTNDAEEVKRSGDKNTAYGAKMDVEDFLRVVEMDDVLVQVLFRRPRTQVLDLIKKARLLFASQQEELQEYREQLRVGGEEGIKTPNGATVPSESDAHTLAADSTNTPSRSFSFRLFSGKKTDVPTANITPSRPSTSRSISRDGAGTLSLLEQRTCTDVLTELVETEVLQALSDTKGVENTKFPIAKAVGRATLTAAFGLAHSVTVSAQAIMEATKETMEGGSVSGEFYDHDSEGKHSNNSSMKGKPCQTHSSDSDDD